MAIQRWALTWTPGPFGPANKPGRWRLGRSMAGGRPPSFISFTCPNCQALYHVVKVEAGPGNFEDGAIAANAPDAMPQ